MRPGIGRLLWAVAPLLAACGPTPAALAVDVEPARLELSVPLEEPTQAELTITNRGPKPVGVKLSVGPYRHSQPGLKIPTAQDWITFEPSYFTLAPGAASTVAVVVRPPLALVNDPAGEYLAAILVDDLPVPAEEPAQAGSSRVTVVPRIALPVYLMIRGRERVAVEIAGLSARVSQPLIPPKSAESAQRLALEEAPPRASAQRLRLDTTLKNLGSVHTRPTGNLAVFNAGGQVVRAVGLGRSPPLLPTATLTIPTLLPFPAPGRYKAVVTVEARDGQLLQREHRFEVTEEGEVIPGATP